MSRDIQDTRAIRILDPEGFLTLGCIREFVDRTAEYDADIEVLGGRLGGDGEIPRMDVMEIQVNVC